jgi:hypothetical protein
MDKENKFVINTADFGNLLPSRFQSGVESRFELVLETPTGNTLRITDTNLSEGCLRNPDFDFTKSKLTKVQQRLLTEKLNGLKLGEVFLYDLVLHVGLRLRDAEANILGFISKFPSSGISTSFNVTEPLSQDIINSIDYRDTILIKDAMLKKIFDRVFFIPGNPPMVAGQNEGDKFLTALTRFQPVRAPRLRSAPSREKKIESEEGRIDPIDILNQPLIEEITQEPTDYIETPTEILPKLNRFSTLLLKIFGQKEYKKKYGI